MAVDQHCHALDDMARMKIGDVVAAGGIDLVVCWVVDPGFPFRLTPMSFALRVTNSP